MDTQHLVDFLRNTRHLDTDITSTIQHSYSQLELNPHKSREKSKALQISRKGRGSIRQEYQSNDFFWKALGPWAAFPRSSVTILQGTQHSRDWVEEIAIKTTELIETKRVPLAWALNVLAKPGDGEEPRGFTGQDIVAQCCLQFLRWNPALHRRSILEICLKKCETATTELEWFEVLAYFIETLDEVYIIVDLDVMGRGISSAAVWPTALEAMFRNFSARDVHCVVKVILLTCTAPDLRGDSPDINVIRVPQKNNGILRREHPSRRPSSTQESDFHSAEVWLQNVGRERPKRAQSPTTREDGDSSHGDTVTMRASKRSKPSNSQQPGDISATVHTPTPAYRHDQVAIESSRRFPPQLQPLEKEGQKPPDLQLQSSNQASGDERVDGSENHPQSRSLTDPSAPATMQPSVMNLRQLSRPPDRDAFEIAVICALPLEADALEALFDRHWDEEEYPYGKARGDPNAYSAGVLGRHNVVLAHMPNMGTASAAIAATSCRTSFPNIRLALVVGICGGVPLSLTGQKMNLGDVVVSDGVVQYDLGRRLPNQFLRKDTLLDSLGRPNMEIRTQLATLKGIRGRRNMEKRMAEYLGVLRRDPELAADRPRAGSDMPFEVAPPVVHFGLIASGNTVMKSGEDRDKIAEAAQVIAFEMEGAGVWDVFPCVVIKGVCDFADSRKNKEWQRYAAATAAACAKAFLDRWVLQV
ncbi:nucleoside phosphorylase domain-containing protein [Thelonectria olida]|uniref:Nucleoside phosphorylase domain-containing protein n=1 Tax=Thelonectria olida TaxID=1576542 RepID=A0A9P8W928_9HYPO|nr:nucleoside phosphorylase domain-containing protein [Thelonectria olida]